MSEFETIFMMLMIPACYTLTYMAGKNDLLNVVLTKVTDNLLLKEEIREMGINMFERSDKYTEKVLDILRKNIPDIPEDKITQIARLISIEHMKDENELVDYFESRVRYLINQEEPHENRR